MGIYYVAGIPYSSDELYHHGIKGQKWGVRKYQNEDGSLTAAGRQRYGQNLGEYASNQSLIRRLATGDHILGSKRYYDRREERLLKKANKAEAAGKEKKAKKLRMQYEGQKAANTNYDIYISHQSTGKLIAKNILLGNYSYAYNRLRSSGSTRAGALMITDMMSRSSYSHARTSSNTTANNSNNYNKKMNDAAIKVNVHIGQKKK